MSSKKNVKEKKASFFKKIIPFWSAHMKLLFLIGLVILLVPLILDLVRPATQANGNGGGYEIRIEDAARNADAMVAVTRGVAAEQIGVYGVDPAKVTVIHNPVSVLSSSTTHPPHLPTCSTVQFANASAPVAPSELTTELPVITG